jgi:hypothetical protein
MPRKVLGAWSLLSIRMPNGEMQASLGRERLHERKEIPFPLERYNFLSGPFRNLVYFHCGLGKSVDNRMMRGQCVQAHDK